MTESYIDWKEQPVKVGDTVKFGVDSDAIGIVSKITESDVDMNDDTMRPEMYPPKLYVKYEDQAEEDYCTGYNVTQINPDTESLTFQFDDIEVVKDEDTAPWRSAMGDRP